MPARIDFGTLDFAEPFYLWLLVVPGTLTVLWGWRVCRRLTDARRFEREHIAPGDQRYPRLGDLSFWLCVIAASSLCVAALARPQAVATVFTRTGADLVFLQDGSASMYVADVKPDRWRRSVQFLRTFAETMSWKAGDRAALALFAHLASPQVRLTKDPNALFFFLDHLGDHSPFRLEDPPTWDTNIEQGVYWGLQLLEADAEIFGWTKNPKAFVVISDGQAWSGDVAEALGAARDKKIPVYVVGVGTTAGGVIPEPSDTDVAAARAAPIRAVLDRESLHEIARMGGGAYFELDQTPDREIARAIVAGVKRNAPVGQIDQRREELYWRFLFAAALVVSLGGLAVTTATELWWQIAAVGIVLGVLAMAI